MRNIFCVAASRGKNQIIFVDSDEAELSEKTLSTPVNMNMKFENMEISVCSNSSSKKMWINVLKQLKPRKLSLKTIALFKLRIVRVC